MKSGLTPRMLNHAAYVTHDVAATADFYTRILGMELASTIFDDHVPSTGDDFPYFHIFFRMADGSTIAFFEVADLPPRATPSHPAYEVFDHMALQAKDAEELRRWRDWLAQNGVDVLGPIDHKGMLESIYFHDPNGIRLELTVPHDPQWNRAHRAGLRRSAEVAGHQGARQARGPRPGEGAPRNDSRVEEALRQSSLILSERMKGSQRRPSSCRNAANCSGVSAMISRPRPESLPLTSGSRTARTISALSLVMMSRGVFAGVATPTIGAISRPG